MRNFLSDYKYFDVPLFIATFLLLIIGLSLQYGISLSGQNLAIFYRHLLFTVTGLVAYFVFSYYSYPNLSRLNRIIYPILIVLLVAVLVFARERRGSTRWINFGFLAFQPAEFAKLVVILGLSRWLSLKRGQINSWKSIALTFLYVLIPGLLIILQPDLGSAVIIFGIWLGILLTSSINKKFILYLILAVVIVSGLGWKLVLKDYQKTRIEVFLNPSLDPRGRGYNVRQATIAVGSGGLWGRGLGQGLQSQLKFLPERQTDFIFASASEEIGFMGCAVLLLLYGFIFYRLFKIITLAKDDLGMFITTGVLFMIFGQVVINVGMNIGLLPVTGIPLPFLSYGGNSMIVTLISLAIVQNIVRQSKILRF
jgi:rod shape determining protein RodA